MLWSFIGLHLLKKFHTKQFLCISLKNYLQITDFLAFHTKLRAQKQVESSSLIKKYIPENFQLIWSNFFFRWKICQNPLHSYVQISEIQSTNFFDPKQTLFTMTFINSKWSEKVALQHCIFIFNIQYVTNQPHWEKLKFGFTIFSRWNRTWSR